MPRGWVAIACASVVSALAVTATATSITASTTPTTVESTTAATGGDAATLGSADFTVMLATACEGDTGQQLLADALQGAVGTDGSLRVVEIVRTCDVEFAGAVDETLGRPSTNVEALIADPANNVTPNQAQIDLLNNELAVYWRITDAWVQSQAGAGTAAPGTAAVDTAAPDTAAPDTAVPDTAVPDTAAVASTQPEETATTAG